MSAGLANRMLQYSYYLYLQKLGYDTYVDNNYRASEWKMEDIEWNRIFPNAPIKQAPPTLIFKYGGGYNFIDKLRRHYFTFLSKVLLLENATAIPSVEERERYGYFIGTMQDSKIAESVKDDVYRCFRFMEFEQGSQNAEYAQKMKNENSVSIHLRKGEDYLKKVQFHNTCTLDYYLKAIGIIMEMVENPVLYVFTDNPTWVKENFRDFDYTLVENNPAIGWGNHYDMQLMSCCKHNIISNSTYSWWAAFLNPNMDKIVIDPKFWFNPEIEKYRALPNKTACKGWILL